MPLVFATGVTGSGKTTACKALEARGFEAYDTDKRGRSAWYNKKTGQVAKRPKALNDQTKNWYSEHTWKLSRSFVEEASHKAKGKLIFLCGAIGNKEEVRPFFDLVIHLTISEKSLKQRLRQPREHDFGKRPGDLERILTYHKASEAKAREEGATMVDAERPIEVVVGEILGHAQRLL